jgi:hypothetical protein
MKRRYSPWGALAFLCCWFWLCWRSQAAPLWPSARLVRVRAAMVASQRSKASQRTPTASEVRPPRSRRTRGLTPVRRARAGSASIPPLKRSRVKASATSHATMELRGTIRATTPAWSPSRWTWIAPKSLERVEWRDSVGRSLLSERRPLACPARGRTPPGGVFRYTPVRPS